MSILSHQVCGMNTRLEDTREYGRALQWYALNNSGDKGWKAAPDVWSYFNCHWLVVNLHADQLLGGGANPWVYGRDSRNRAPGALGPRVQRGRLSRHDGQVSCARNRCRGSSGLRAHNSSGVSVWHRDRFRLGRLVWGGCGSARGHYELACLE